MNKPMILGCIPIVRSLIESGETIFFVMFGAGLLIMVYSTYKSVTGTLLCVSGLVSLYTFKFAFDFSFPVTDNACTKAMKGARKNMINGGQFSLYSDIQISL
jgi:hypothetical protein